jgi:hypothetical protein
MQYVYRRAAWSRQASLDGRDLGGARAAYCCECTSLCGEAPEVTVPGGVYAPSSGSVLVLALLQPAIKAASATHAKSRLIRYLLVKTPDAHVGRRFPLPRANLRTLRAGSCGDERRGGDDMLALCRASRHTRLLQP